MRICVGADAWHEYGVDECRRHGADESQLGDFAEPGRLADADACCARSRLEPDADGRWASFGRAAVGGDKLYSVNWLMGAFSHKLGERGALQFEAMLSLEPATVTERRYPLLFQTGETAFGRPIVDGQHPHNFVMSLGANYTHEVAAGTFLSVYAAPVGDPDLSPIRAPRVGRERRKRHHWQDSTHISDDVVTAGIAHTWFKLEASGFHGAEPGENAFGPSGGLLDSYSGRISGFCPRRIGPRRFPPGA